MHLHPAPPTAPLSTHVDFLQLKVTRLSQSAATLNLLRRLNSNTCIRKSQLEQTQGDALRISGVFKSLTTRYTGEIVLLQRPREAA